MLPQLWLCRCLRREHHQCEHGNVNTSLVKACNFEEFVLLATGVCTSPDGPVLSKGHGTESLPQVLIYVLGFISTTAFQGCHQTVRASLFQGKRKFFLSFQRHKNSFTRTTPSNGLNCKRKEALVGGSNTLQRTTGNWLKLRAGEQVLPREGTLIICPVPNGQPWKHTYN